MFVMAMQKLGKWLPVWATNNVHQAVAEIECWRIQNPEMELALFLESDLPTY